jgi:hypothetical protein
MTIAPRFRTATQAWCAIEVSQWLTTLAERIELQIQLVRGLSQIAHKIRLKFVSKPFIKIPQEFVRNGIRRLSRARIGVISKVTAATTPSRRLIIRRSPGVDDGNWLADASAAAGRFRMWDDATAHAEASPARASGKQDAALVPSPRRYSRRYVTAMVQSESDKLVTRL